MNSYLNTDEFLTLPAFAKKFEVDKLLPILKKAFIEAYHFVNCGRERQENYYTLAYIMLMLKFGRYEDKGKIDFDPIIFATIFGSNE